MDLTTTLNPRFLKEGDKVRLTGESWNERQKGLIRTVGKPSASRDNCHNIVEQARSTHVIYVDKYSDFSATLIERGGKKVSAIAQRDSDEGVSLLIQFEDGRVEGEDGFAYLSKDNAPRRRAEISDDWHLIYDAGKAGIEDDEVDIADIQKFADDLGMCSEFDLVMHRTYGWASRKVTTPTYGQLRELAHDQGYGTAFDKKYPKVEPEEPYVVPTMPTKGDRVKVTRKDGSVVEGEVTRALKDARTGDLFVDGKRAGFVFSSSERYHEYSLADLTIKSIEVLYVMPTVPEKGDLVEFVTRAGVRREGRVQTVEECEGSATFPHKYTRLYLEGRQYDGHYIFHTEDGVKQYDNRTRTIKSLTVTEEKEWKVGDIVPAGTALKKYWIGVIDGPLAQSWINRSTTLPVGTTSDYDRRIAWIQE